MTVTIEEISAMLADLPPSEWEQQMATVRARENELVADRDRLQAECERWKGRASKLAGLARQWRESSREWRAAYERDPNTALATTTAALAAAQSIIDSECPVGSLDIVTSLRVAKAHMAEALAEAEAHAARHHGEMKGSEAIIAQLRADLDEALGVIAGLYADRAEDARLLEQAHKATETAEARAEVMRQALAETAGAEHAEAQRLAEVDHTVTKMKAGLQDYLAASEHAARDARWKAALSEIGLRATEALQMHGVTGWDQPYDGTGDALLGVKDIADSTLAEPSGKGRG